MCAKCAQPSAAHAPFVCHGGTSYGTYRDWRVPWVSYRADNMTWIHAPLWLGEMKLPAAGGSRVGYANRGEVDQNSPFQGAFVHLIEEQNVLVDLRVAERIDDRRQKFMRCRELS